LRSAYVWYSLAASQGDAYANKLRDIAAEKLPPEALIEAQKQAAKLQEEIESRRKKE
jgi:TPR repeat protein